MCNHATNCPLFVDDTGVESSESIATPAQPVGDNDDDTATTSEAAKEGGAEASGSGQEMMDAESSEVVGMEVEQSGDSSGVSTSHGQQPAQPVSADTDTSGASSSGQDNVSTAPEQVSSDASSAEDNREAVPVDTEEEGRAETEEDNNTATDNTVGHSKEVAVDNVESSQDTQQSSSSR